jgi:hypothetical protein
MIMSRLRFSGFALGLGLLTAGCAGSTMPGQTATAFDGDYAGTVTYIHVAANSCATTEPAPAKLTVANGSVMWAASATASPIYAPVMANGAFQASANAVIFSGKINNRAMVARVNTGSCHLIYDLTRPT